MNTLALANLYIPAYNGVTLGFGPEAAGISNVLANIAAQNTEFAKNYAQGKEDYAKQLEQARGEHPGISFILELGGGSLTGGMLSKLIRKGLGVANTLRKAKQVKINFEGDSRLPNLNKSDLEIMGAENKPILFKHETVNRNLEVHPDFIKEDYPKNIGQALYKHKIGPLRDLKNSEYYHYIGEPIKPSESRPIVLLDASKSKPNFEIVHAHKMRKGSFNSFMKRYNKKPN